MSKSGKSDSRYYWRSLDQLADTKRYREFLHREFPEGTVEMGDGSEDNSWSRRSFLTLMGASMALAGLAACRKPVEKIIPYVERPEDVSPGTPLSYATTMPLGNGAMGMLVTSNDGRPTKVEGNPEHPSSRGAASATMQASILDLYDPDRSRSVMKGNGKSDWSSFIRFWINHVNENHARGEGLAVLSESFSSPTMWRLREAFLDRYPRARWVGYDPVSDENSQVGIETALGRRYQPLYDFSGVRTIVSLDSDFLGSETDALSNSVTFAESRRVLSKKDSMNRLYVVESAYSVTGGSADHRLRLPCSQIAGFALAVAGHLKNLGLNIDALNGVTSRPGAAFNMEWVALLAEELISNKGQSLIIAGRRQPPAVHALVCAMNEALGNVGKSVHYVRPQDSLAPSVGDLQSLVKDMSAGKVRTLVMLGGNPVYSAPADLSFTEALEKVPTSVHLSSHLDETSAVSTWHINRAHFLESWGDARGTDGTASIVQPLIRPLHGGMSDIEFAALLSGGSVSSGYDSVRRTWSRLLGSPFDNHWRRVLHDGLLAGSSSSRVRPKVRSSAVRSALNRHTFSGAPADGELEVSFHVSHLHDGRFANNAWLQELPDPVTRLAWDNAALLSVATAKKFGVKNEDLVRLSVDGKEMTLPVWISPGQADNCAAVALGYGRSKAGKTGSGVGFDSYALRVSGNGDFRRGVRLTPTGETYKLANVQDHGSMMGRPIVREATLAAYRKDDGHDPFVPEQTEHPPLAALWDEHSYDKGHQWGMTIDLNACTGCNACVIACQSENNVPVVGKDQVREGREMHWIRLDRYYTGDKLGDNNDPSSEVDVDDVEMVVQPVTCQQCENAPCETVCPVGATVHDSEGLNVMVYNRCIGTRYCSNNCPYKVRRFNFFNLTKDMPELVKMAQNPEVTVRSRGVMEKCTFCVQRIVAGKNRAKLEKRPLADGDIVPACAQTCPTKAIVFGDIRDKNSQVMKMKKVNRNYNLLEELFTKPRTSYLGRLRNKNPEMKG